MADLSIPERYRRGVSRISKLDLGTVRAFRQALDNAVYNERNPRAASAAVEAMGSVAPETPEGEYKALSEALASMSVVQSSEDIPLDEFTEAIARDLEALPDSELRLDANDRTAFKEKLSILLGAEMFGLIAKVGDLKTESDHVFCHARIFTDVRPVFGSQVEKGPIAALVMHNLKLAFHLSGRRGDHDFYVALDADDLSTLKEVIIRAEEKAKTLRDMINNKVRLLGDSK